MSPSGPRTSPLESEEAGQRSFGGEDPRSSRPDPLFGAAPPSGGQQRLPNGITGAVSSSVAACATDVVPQTTIQPGGGGQQGPRGAPDAEDRSQGSLSGQAAMLRGYGAADAGTQAVALREPESSLVAADLQAGAGTTETEANAAIIAAQEERTQYGTPRSTRTAWPEGPLGDMAPGLPQGLRWLGRLGEYFRSGTGQVESVAPMMWPSPFPSPDRGQEDGRSGQAGGLFSTESLRRLQAVQDRAPLLYGTPQRAPNRTQTPSSSGLSAK